MDFQHNNKSICSICRKLLSANYIKMNVKDGKQNDQPKDLYWHERITKSLIENENVEFCYEV